MEVDERVEPTVRKIDHIPDSEHLFPVVQKFGGENQVFVGVFPVERIGVFAGVERDEFGTVDASPVLSVNGPGVTQDGDSEENSFHGGIVL